jgi:hypothetical protein
MERLTGLGNTDILDTLGRAFDKEIYTVVPKLSDNHTSTAELRDEFEVSKDSEFNGNLQQIPSISGKSSWGFS